MTNHEIVQETVIFNGERVDYEYWLRQPVFETFWWSPAGAHVEALVQVGRGKNVSWEVINTLQRVHPDKTMLETINEWNEFGRSQKDKYKEAMTIPTLMGRIIDSYDDDHIKNAHFSQCNPAHIDNAKKFILKLAVQLR